MNNHRLIIEFANQSDLDYFQTHAGIASQDRNQAGFQPMSIFHVIGRATIKPDDRDCPRHDGN